MLISHVFIRFRLQNYNKIFKYANIWIKIIVFACKIRNNWNTQGFCAKSQIYLNILWKILLFAQLCDYNKYLSPFMQIYANFPSKTHFLERMSLKNLYICEKSSNFARFSRRVKNSNRICVDLLKIYLKTWRGTPSLNTRVLQKRSKQTWLFLL